MPSEALELTASTYLVLGSLGHMRPWSGALSELRRACTCGTEGLLDAGPKILGGTMPMSINVLVLCPGSSSRERTQVRRLVYEVAPVPMCANRRWSEDGECN